MYVSAAITLRQKQTSTLTNKVGLYNEMAPGRKSRCWVGKLGLPLLYWVVEANYLQWTSKEGQSWWRSRVGVGVGNTTLVSVRNTRPKGAVSALMVFPQEMPDQLAVWLQMRFASRLGKDLGEPGGTAWRFRTARWIVPPEAQRVLGNPRGQDWAGSASLGPDLVGSITDQPGGARWCHASVK